MINKQTYIKSLLLLLLVGLSMISANAALQVGSNEQRGVIFNNPVISFNGTINCHNITGSNYNLCSFNSTSINVTSPYFYGDGSGITNVSSSPHTHTYSNITGNQYMSNTRNITNVMGVHIGSTNVQSSIPLTVYQSNANTAMTTLANFTVADTGGSGRVASMFFGVGANNLRGGKWCFGEAGGGYPLQCIQAQLNDFQIKNVGAYPITFYTTNLERMRIDATGNVKINNPASTLTANGSVVIKKNLNMSNTGNITNLLGLCVGSSCGGITYSNALTIRTGSSQIFHVTNGDMQLYNTVSGGVFEIRTIGTRGLKLTSATGQIFSKSNLNMSNVGNITNTDYIKNVKNLTGTGNAYVCVNSVGTLYRSATACS